MKVTRHNIDDVVEAIHQKSMARLVQDLESEAIGADLAGEVAEMLESARATNRDMLRRALLDGARAMRESTDDDES